MGNPNSRPFAFLNFEWSMGKGYTYKTAQGTAIANGVYDTDGEYWKLIIDEDLISMCPAFEAISKHQFHSTQAMEWAILFVAQHLADTGH